MSYKGVFEFILVLHDFKNIDLPNQGLAAISASIYKEQKGKQPIFAIPYEFPYERVYKLNKKKIKEQSYIQDSFFRSKVVSIKYSEEEITMDDFIQFRMQLQAFPNLNTEDVYLELNLLFSNRFYSSEDQKFDGKPVSQIRLRLKDIENGIISHVVGQFKQEYFSEVSLTLYGQLMYYKFEKYQPVGQNLTTSKDISRSKIDNFQKLLIWSKTNYLQKGQDPFQIFYSNYVKNLRHSNYTIQSKLNQYLIVKRKVSIKVPSKFLQTLGLKAQSEVTEKIFRQYLENPYYSLTLEDIPKQIHEIRIQNFQFLQNVIEQIYHDQLDLQKMKGQYYSYIKEKYGERVFKNTLYNQDENLQNALKQNKKIAKQMRSKNMSLIQFPIENQVIFNKKEDHQFIFYEITLPQYMKNKDYKKPLQIKQKSQLNENTEAQSKQSKKHFDCGSSDEQASQNTQKSDNLEYMGQFFGQNNIKFDKIKYHQKNMLIIMCHGFQGSSYDMACIHKGIKAVLPHASYLLSRKNQDDTEGDIQHMGEKLADEIKYYIRAFMDQQTVILNFVGHSMGGIIARSSFKHLVKYRQQFGFFCSLSSPHLGYLNGVENKIKAGLWVMRKWKPTKSLDQLSMQEAKNPRSSFLYRLSKQGTLKYFRKLIFFSSFQDSYVTWHSARVSLHTSKNQESKIQNEMVQNILGLKHGINQDSTVHRLDINFNVKGNDINNLIGRTAHINLIIQDSLFDVVNTTLPDLFNLKEYQNGLVI